MMADRAAGMARVVRHIAWVELGKICFPGSVWSNYIKAIQNPQFSFHWPSLIGKCVEVAWARENDEVYMSFTPPYFFDYPPYFTLQPVEETRRKQSALWQRLILDYCQAHKIYKISLSEGQEPPIFANTKINRRLGQEAKTAFLSDLVTNRNALWLDKSHQTYLILWHKLDIWAQMIYEWARASGMQDSVTTIDDLSTGDETLGTEIHGTPRELLISALKILEGQGKARLFKGAAGDDDGVKFFS